MTAPGVIDTPPVTFFIHVQHATVENPRKVFDTHTLRQGMPGWTERREDHADLRVHASILCPLTTRP